MFRPSHEALLRRLSKEVDEHLAENNGTPPAPRIYTLRKTMKRWYRDLANFRLQLEEIETAGKSKEGYTDPSYARARIKEINEKIEELSKLDLRTDEEKRGHSRKDYTFDPVTQMKIDDGLGGLTNEHYLQILARTERRERKRRREQKKLKRLQQIPGHSERRKLYEHKRSLISGDPRTLHVVQTASAAKAIAEKHGGSYEYSENELTQLDNFVAILARLEDLDREFADVADVGLLNPLAGIFTHVEVMTRTKNNTVTTIVEEHDPS